MRPLQNEPPTPPPDDGFGAVLALDGTAETHASIKGLPSKFDSRISNDSNRSIASHQEYLNSLEVPTPGEVGRIAEAQDQKEQQVLEQKVSMENPDLTGEEKTKAVAMIQRNYRGYRARRNMAGLSLDASSRWTEAIKEARYRNLTTPRARDSIDNPRNSVEEQTDTGSHRRHPSQNWKKVSMIARRAAADEDSEDESDEGLTEEQRAARRKTRAEMRKNAKVMDMGYWLEMTDLKHRYGSNLKTYHAEWKRSDTHENFFYWLDFGEGQNLDVPGCTRERLDRERVRYLSREERNHYLVKIDKEGRLCWARDGKRIDTSEHFKDSVNGIVPENDPTPAYAAPEAEAATGLQDHFQGRSSTSSASTAEQDARANKYTTPDLDKAKGMTKVKHVSAATIFNKLLRSSVKKNTWIFVADTSLRLYVGIKQSGAFQHSSFLHGSRISAAGLIKIKDGRLDKLSPLSGHYRPRTESFRAFIHSLKEAGCDMSHVSISRSYAVLVGLEAYVKTRKRGKKLVQAIIHGRDKLLSPDEVKMRQEEELDKSESAAMERRFLELQREAEEEERRNEGLLGKLHLGSRSTTEKENAATITGRDKATTGGLDGTEEERGRQSRIITGGETKDEKRVGSVGENVRGEGKRGKDGKEVSTKHEEQKDDEMAKENIIPAAGTSSSRVG